MSEVVKDILKIEGFFGLYRGFIVSFNRDIISYGFYFYIYYKLKDYWEERKSCNSFKLMFAGGLSGAFTWAITYPFDTLKTIIQTNYNSKTMSQRDAYNIVVKQTGTQVCGLFKGLSPTVFRGFFTNAVIFYTNELCHDVFDKFI